MQPNLKIDVNADSSVCSMGLYRGLYSRSDKTSYCLCPEFLKPEEMGMELSGRS